MSDTELRSWAEANKRGIILGAVAWAVIRCMDALDTLRRASQKPCVACGHLPKITYTGGTPAGFTSQMVPLNPGPPQPDPLDGVRDMEPTVSLGSNDAMRRQEDRAAEGK